MRTFLRVITVDTYTGQRASFDVLLWEFGFIGRMQPHMPETRGWIPENTSGSTELPIIIDNNLCWEKTDKSLISSYKKKRRYRKITDAASQRPTWKR